MASTNSSGQVQRKIFVGTVMDIIICLMPEPQAVNKLSVQMEKSTWKYVEEHLG
jgi:hypothetical protein